MKIEKCAAHTALVLSVRDVLFWATLEDVRIYTYDTD
jgi:hypothetical protein